MGQDCSTVTSEVQNCTTKPIRTPVVGLILLVTNMDMDVAEDRDRSMEMNDEMVVSMLGWTMELKI